MTRLFIEGVTGIDCGILDSSLGLIGQSWLVDLELNGPLNDQGMVIDFGVVKPALRDICLNSFDHRLLIPTQSPRLSTENTNDGFRVTYGFGASAEQVVHFSPEASVRHVDAAQISRSLLEDQLALELSAMINGSDISVRIRLREAHERAANSFRYTHGLRQHNGACQRIGHGHSSQLEIRLNGERSINDESTAVTDLLNKHIVSSADIINRSHTTIRLGYDAEAGRHELELPSSRVFCVDGEATIENIAELIADDCADRHSGAEVEVTVWEGIGKGAKATRE